MTSITKTLHNGIKIPWIGFGTGTALYSQPVDGPTALAVQAGFKHLDGAQVYNNEVRIIIICNF
jgi:diketogulonate reductase-like aldo/keto reductase